MLGAACGWALLGSASLAPMLALALALSALSLLDDFRGLPVALRFGAQVAAAGLLIWLGPPLPGGIVAAVWAVLALTWMTNLYNFMDGSNGLAGGMALFGFSFYAVAAWQAGAPGLAATSAVVAAAAAGFLLFNFHPARIFMGDGGSIPLGFLAASLGLAGWQEGRWSLIFPVLVFSPFIADASVTLAKRLLRGDKVWQAHREHYYQRLVRMGLGHRGTALAEYGLMMACGISGLMILNVASTQFRLLIVAAWLTIYVLIMISIDLAWRKQAVEE